jgi:TPR repeat protein
MGKEFFELAKQFDKSGDYTKARTYLERAAESNYAPAQTALGVAKLTNKDDLNERLHGLGLITLAGNAGDSKARHILANSLLKNDLGLPIDQEEGVRRFRKLMQEGSAEARYMLGKVYITGTGVEKDEALGLVYIKRAAEKGSPTGPTDHGQRLC